MITDLENPTWNNKRHRDPIHYSVNKSAASYTTISCIGAMQPNPSHSIPDKLLEGSLLCTI